MRKTEGRQKDGQTVGGTNGGDSHEAGIDGGTDLMEAYKMHVAEKGI